MPKVSTSRTEYCCIGERKMFPKPKPLRMIRIDGIYDSTIMRPKAVYINGKELPLQPSLKLLNHSPDGFNWGYEGSGPAQLALAILLYCYPENKYRDFVVGNHQQFKRDIIAPLEFEHSFSITIDIDRWAVRTMSGLIVGNMRDIVNARDLKLKDDE